MGKEEFTVAEFKKYLLSQDSMGDMLYNLSANNIIKANDEDDDEDCDATESDIY
jgi:hypothetical protein